MRKGVRLNNTHSEGDFSPTAGQLSQLNLVSYAPLMADGEKSHFLRVILPTRYRNGQKAYKQCLIPPHLWTIDYRRSPDK